jgi:hypothetical protein
MAHGSVDYYVIRPRWVTHADSYIIKLKPVILHPAFRPCDWLNGRERHLSVVIVRHTLLFALRVRKLSGSDRIVGGQSKGNLQQS